MGGDAAGRKVFVDLSTYPTRTRTLSGARVKMVDVVSRRDLKALTDMAYGGGVIVMDFSRFADGDLQKRSMADELMRTAADVNGAFMEVSDRIMILSCNGMPIDRVRQPSGG